MAAIRSFRELNVYKEARKQARAIYELSKRFPKEERYSLTDQIRRASRAVGAMVGEGWARRRYEAAFIDKMSQASAEATETQVWLDHALDCGYITADEHQQSDDRWQHVGAMLARMIDRSATFCGAASK